MPQKKTKVIREIPENPFIQGQAKRKKLRVAAYCRVSTEQEEQESSFENQVAYYTDLIQSNPEWEFAGIFADRGISGTKDTIRPEFMKMIEHCQRHKIDLIFTKSLSRFSRNTLDSIKYIRLLKSLNVTIEFENLEFGDQGAGKLILCGSTPLEKNTIIVRFISDGKEERQMLEFAGGQETQEFVLKPVYGTKTVCFVFLPGSSFDFRWFCFKKQGEK